MRNAFLVRMITWKSGLGELMLRDIGDVIHCSAICEMPCLQVTS